MRAASRCCVFFGAAVTMLSAANAQERTPNAGTSGVLRSWPATGAWGVVLLRLADGELGCLVATGHRDAQTGEQYVFGIRWRRESVGVAISDKNQQAVAGPSIQIVIDRVPVGSYQISRRIENNGFQNVAAEFPPNESDRVLGLVGVGGQIQFVTSTFTYSAPLQGAQQALANFKACTIEASHLDSAKSQ